MAENRPMLVWTDEVYDLQELLSDRKDPIYLVGGVVRDSLLRAPTKDIDLVVESGAIALARTIANHLRADVYPLDAERDIGRVLFTKGGETYTIDISAYRDGAQTLEEDLHERDFTFNAIAVDLRDLDTLIDPLDGLNDLIAKRLRRCRPGAIANEPIRAMRAVRQSVQFNCRIDADTMKEIREASGRLRLVSPERIRDELIKLLALNRPTAGLRAATALGILDVLLPDCPTTGEAWTRTLATIDAIVNIINSLTSRKVEEIASQFQFGMVIFGLGHLRSRLNGHLTALFPNERPRRALLALAALLRSAPSQAHARQIDGLRLSREEGDLIVRLLRDLDTPSTAREDALEPLTLYRFWQLFGDKGIDRVLMELAVYLGQPRDRFEQDEWLRRIERGRGMLEAYFNERDRLIDPPALIDGHGLMMALNLKPSARLGELLAGIREAQVTGDVTTEEQAIAWARARIAQSQDDSSR